MRPPWLLLPLLLSWLVPAPLAAQPAASAAPPVPLTPAWDPWPHGRLFGGATARPGPSAVRVCSFEAPLCVHAARTSDGPAALAVLAEAERAHRFLRLQARLPDPEGDGSEGGSSAFDLYLRSLGGPPLRVHLGGPTRFPRDRAPVHAELEERLRGCERDEAVHRAVATAMLAEVDGGEAGASFGATASYLAMMSSGCEQAALAALDEAQAHPERPLLVPGEADDPGASPLLPWWLDATLGVGAPGSLLTALWYGAQQSTPANSPRHRNVPDLLLVTGRLARARQSTPDAMLLDLGVTRAFLGERDDGAHLAESAWLGGAGRVRFDASWPWSSLPRRLAFRPLQPTGMVYAWVDLRGAGEHPKLALQTTWEYPVTMRWALVRVDADGQEISRLVPPHQRGATSVQSVIEELEGAAGVLIVGVNNGEIDLEEPLHLDETPYEPHAGTIHVFVPPT